MTGAYPSSKDSPSLAIGFLILLASVIPAPRSPTFQSLGAHPPLSLSQVLELSNCTFTGPLPTSLSSFLSLSSLSIALNSITGTIPEGLFSPSMASLRSVRLNNNRLSGALPPSLSSPPPLLSELWLHGNQLTGTIPSDIASPSSPLSSLRLSANNLVGFVPPSLGSAPNLSDLQLRQNRLVGPIPSFLSSFPASSYSQNGFCTSQPGVDCDAQTMALLLFLQGQQFPPAIAATWQGASPCGTGWIGVGCRNSSHVTSLMLPRQGLQGSISPSLSNLTDLQVIQLPDNNISGSVPDSLASLSSLQLLNLTNNDLSGVLPMFPPSVKLEAAENQFSTSPPSTPSSPSSPFPSQSPPPSSSSSSPPLTIGLIAAIAVAGAAVVAALLFAGCWFLCMRTRVGPVAGAAAASKE